MYHNDGYAVVGKKHTIFGGAIAGLEIIHAIENVEANKTDRQFKDISIVNIDVQWCTYSSVHTPWIHQMVSY